MACVLALLRVYMALSVHPWSFTARVWCLQGRSGALQSERHNVRLHGRAADRTSGMRPPLSLDFGLLAAKGWVGGDGGGGGGGPDGSEPASLGKLAGAFSAAAPHGVRFVVVGNCTAATHAEGWMHGSSNSRQQQQQQ